MENEMIPKKNSTEILEKPEQDANGLTVIENTKKPVDWEKIKLTFFLSAYKQARPFLIGEKYFTQKEINNGNINKAIIGWELEKKDWEKQALDITMHNLRESKAVEMKNFIEEESQVISQLLNMTKIAMNDLILKGKNKTTGKDVLSLVNTKGFKQITEATISILKYSRDRLGISFDKEEAGLKNAANLNFDLINVDDFDIKQVVNIFKKKDEQQSNTKPIEADSISPISKVVNA